MSIKENDIIIEEPKTTEIDLDYKAGNFSFDLAEQGEETFRLLKLDLRIKKGELVIVIG